MEIAKIIAKKNTGPQASRKPWDSKPSRPRGCRPGRSTCDAEGRPGRQQVGDDAERSDHAAPAARAAAAGSRARGRRRSRAASWPRVPTRGRGSPLPRHRRAPPAAAPRAGGRSSAPWPWLDGSSSGSPAQRQPVAAGRGGITARCRDRAAPCRDRALRSRPWADDLERARARPARSACCTAS